VWRIVLSRFSVKLVLCRGIITRLDRKYKSERTTFKSTSRNQYWETASDAYATMRYVVAAGNKTQCKLGLLILLCQWTSYCPLAVKSFLAVDSSVAYLTALLSSQENNDDLQETLLQSMCALLIGICVHSNDDSVPTYTKVNTDWFIYLIYKVM